MGYFPERIQRNYNIILRNMLQNFGISIAVKQVIHPIHDQTFYLTKEHKIKLKEEYGVEPWTFEQKLGEAVFIPAGCPHQVRNLKSCIKVAMDFVSPENVGECIKLTGEFRRLPSGHKAKADKLEIKKIALHALNEVINFLDPSSFERLKSGADQYINKNEAEKKSRCGVHAMDRRFGIIYHRKRNIELLNLPGSGTKLDSAEPMVS